MILLLKVNKCFIFVTIIMEEHFVVLK